MEFSFEPWHGWVRCFVFLFRFSCSSSLYFSYGRLQWRLRSIQGFMPRLGWGRVFCDSEPRCLGCMHNVGPLEFCSCSVSWRFYNKKVHVEMAFCGFLSLFSVDSFDSASLLILWVSIISSWRLL
ncbi:hypothetical protein GGI43DRAFT_266860 [Trichoderma evansii]